MVLVGRPCLPARSEGKDEIKLKLCLPLPKAIGIAITSRDLTDLRMQPAVGWPEPQSGQRG